VRIQRAFGLRDRDQFARQAMIDEHLLDGLQGKQASLPVFVIIAGRGAGTRRFRPNIPHPQMAAGDFQDTGGGPHHPVQQGIHPAGPDERGRIILCVRAQRQQDQGEPHARCCARSRPKNNTATCTKGSVQNSPTAVQNCPSAWATSLESH
jgi:hypothetical protein